MRIWRSHFSRIQTTATRRMLKNIGWKPERWRYLRLFSHILCVWRLYCNFVERNHPCLIGVYWNQSPKFGMVLLLLTPQCTHFCILNTPCFVFETWHGHWLTADTHILDILGHTYTGNCSDSEICLSCYTFHVDRVLGTAYICARSFRLGYMTKGILYQS